MPDRARDAGDADQEHDGPGREQETQKPDQQSHYRSSVPTLCADICGVHPTTAIPPNEMPPRGRTNNKVRRTILTDSEDQQSIFYTVAAVAKLGLGPPAGRVFSLPLRNAHWTFHLPGPVVASRLAKNASIAWAIAPTVRHRQLSDTRCSRSALFET